MPYISLYRKYRSQTFEDVIGQDHVVRTIRNAIRAERIGQGYLFCGSRGTGKTTVARLIAKALNCVATDGPTPDPCGVCDACRAITEGNAVDVVEMDAASNRGVDDVDSLREGVKYPPMHLRYKVYIIDEAHQLSNQAKDAFLKTLEEPPPHAVFILATTESHKIPITIRSRCQQFDFRRGTIGEISTRLKYVVTSEGAHIDDDAVDVLARAANGSYRDSLSLLEQIMAYTEGKIASKDVYTVLGMVDEEVLLELGEVLAGSDTASAFSLADRLLREGRDVKELLRSAALHFRDLLALKAGADTRCASDKNWVDQAAKYSQDQLVRIIDILSAAEKDLRWNEQHRLGLEMALLRAMARSTRETAPMPTVAVAPRAPAPVAPPVQPVYKPEPAPPAPVAASVPPTQPVAHEAPLPVESVPSDEPETPVQQASKGSASIAEVQREWQKILRHTQKIMRAPMVAACAREGQPLGVVDSVLTIGFTKKWDFHRERLEADAKIFEQGILDILGSKLRIKTTLIEDDAAPVRAAAIEQSEPQQHPLMNDVIMTFEGTIVQDDNDPWEE